MGRLLSCTGCKFAAEPCEQAAKMRAALKGLGIRTVKFACPKRENILSPGQPAIFNTLVPIFDDSGETLAVAYPGYVIEQKGSKVFGFIKPGTLDTGEEYPFEAKCNGFVKIPLSRVHADPSREPASIQSCWYCGSYAALGDTRCDKSHDYPPHGKCLADALPSGADHG